jgi:plastocyanin
MKRFLLMAALALAVPTGLSAAPVNGKVMFMTRRGQNPVVNETLVWLEPAAKTWKKPPAALTLTTRSKAFLPHVVAVPVGSTVTFPNEDPIAHNLFSLAPGNTFDLGLYRRGPGKTHKFDAPGTVSVFCNVHPTMSAVVHVMSTPFYGFADASGNYSFDVPPGRYRATAWNEQGGTSAASDLEVKPDGTVAGATLLTIDGRNFRVTQHTNKFGQTYRPPKDY